MPVLSSVRYFLLFISVLIVPFSVSSQEPVEVKKSSNKVVLEGRIYYIHVVKPGQTLYSISKAYEVSEKEIAIENPGAYSGLRVGQVLKIPDKPSQISKPDPDDSITFIRHHLEKGENIYALSRKYNVAPQEIKNANPDLNYEDLDIGQVILIPRTNVVYRDEDFIRHKVRRKETLYGISKRYDLKVEDIEKYNPELQWGELKTGQILRIPRAELLKKDKEAVTDTMGMGIGIVLDEEVKDTVPLMDIDDYKDSLVDLSGRSIKVAYLIPFNYEELMFRDSLEERQNEGEDKEENENSAETIPWSVKFLEFFEGSLLAIDSLKRSGLSLDVHFYDTQKRPERVREIVRSDFFRDVDLIIGPFYSWNVEIVNEFSKRYHVPMISPFYAEESVTRDNPYMFQMNPSDKTEYIIASEYLAKDYDRNFVFIHSADSALNKSVENFKTSLLKSLSRYTFPENVVIKEIVYDNAAKADLTADLNLTLSKDRKNVIIIPDTEEAFVSTIMTQLYFRLKDFDIEVFGKPHFVLFGNAEMYKYYHALGLRYLTPYYFNYDEKRINNFLESYLKYFQSEPSMITNKGAYYAFLGYDMSFFFLEKISRYEQDFIAHLNDPGIRNLMTNFHFRRPSIYGGFENESLELVKYNNDFSIDVEQAFMVPQHEKEEPEEESPIRFRMKDLF